MKKYLSLLLAIILVFSLAACGNIDDKETKDNTDTTAGDTVENKDNTDTTAGDTVENKDTPKELYTLGDYTIEYKGAKIASDDDGYPSVIITVGFTNDSDFEATCSDNLYAKAQQKGESMSYAMLSADEYYKKIAVPGETIDVTFGYLLNPVDYDGNYNYTDAITLTISNPIAEADCSITIDPTTLANEAVTGSNG